MFISLGIVIFKTSFSESMTSYQCCRSSAVVTLEDE
jgi:hypothetical protein